MAEDGGPLLTIAELADRLGRSQTTVRNWRRAFRDLAGAHVGTDRQRRYPLALFEAIAVLYERGLPTAQVRAELERRPGEVAPPVVDHQEAILLELRAIRAAVERIAELMAERNE